MIVQVKDPKKWYNQYEKTPETEKYQYVENTINQKLSREFVNKSGVFDVSLDLFNSLMSTKEFEKMVNLYESMIPKNRKCFDSDLYYFTKKVAKYYLYNNDLKGIRTVIKDFEYLPAEAIDEMIDFSDKLANYGYGSLARELSENVFEKIRDNERLMSGATQSFSECIFFEKLQEIFDLLRANEEFNREDVLDYYELYDIHYKERINFRHVSKMGLFTLHLENF